MPGEAQCTNAEKVPFTLAPKTASGKDATLDGPVVVTVVSGNGSAVVNADGVSGFLVSGDDPGDTSYLFKADADLGQGVTEISDTATLHVTGELAVNLGLGFGAAVPK
jgi:hypothetical protein